MFRAFAITLGKRSCNDVSFYSLYGISRSFNAMARTVMTIHGPVAIEFIPLPSDFQDRYQHFTEAELTGSRAGVRTGNDTA
jgi:ADP-L-glycero-D-manno-heptose 6-epimerase